MRAHGAAIVVSAALIGLVVGMQNSLDGLQTALAAAAAWMVLSSIYHGAMAFVPRRRRPRR